MDVDCETICGTFFNTVERSTRVAIRSNSATNLCFGISGMDYCQRGKELMWSGNVKGQSSFKTGMSGSSLGYTLMSLVCQLLICARYE